MRSVAGAAGVFRPRRSGSSRHGAPSAASSPGEMAGTPTAPGWSGPSGRWRSGSHPTVANAGPAPTWPPSSAASIASTAEGIDTGPSTLTQGKPRGSASGRDLDWYFRSWLYEEWALDHRVKEVTASEKGTKIVIEDSGRAVGPATVAITYANGREIRKTISVDHWLAGNTSAVIEAGPDVRRVEIDPERRTLDHRPGNNVWPSTEGMGRRRK